MVDRKSPRPVDPATVPCDYVLCTHAHGDHIADALQRARKHGATIVAPFELAEYFAAQGATTLDLMPGGGVDLPLGRIQMTPAIHSSALELPDGENRSRGVPSGYVVRAGGRTLYHAGDTALFGDMSLIGRHGLDVALIPIGDFYTMGPADANEALNYSARNSPCRCITTARKRSGRTRRRLRPGRRRRGKLFGCCWQVSQYLCKTPKIGV